MTLYMRADIREQWMEELRSGNYQQGSGELHLVKPVGYDVYEERYCCLGVLCLMGVRAGAIDSDRTNEDNLVYYEGEGVYLPQKVIDWAGIKFEGERMFTDSKVEEARGVLTAGTREAAYRDSKSLSAMNDSLVPFDEIADVIRNEVVPV